MVIGIVGTRRRDSSGDYDLVEQAFLQVYKLGDEIVSGGCHSGADRFAEMIARRFDIPITIYYADWIHKGSSAGFQRNSLIARDADILIACASSDRIGGTEDTIRKFQKAGKTQLVLV
jgi:hypothetical protein